MTVPGYPAIWYWDVGDTNPTTQVFESSSGTFVANNAANYLSWVANGGQSGPFYVQSRVTGAASNGAGGIRIACTTTGNMTTGQKWVIQSIVGTTEANGTNTVTVIDATHFDIPIVFVNPWISGGVVDRGSPIDTAVHLNLLLTSFGLSLIPTLQGSFSSTPISTSVTVTLSNPLATCTIINNTGGSGIDVNLPIMNVPNSIPIGVPFFIINSNGSLNTVHVSLNGGGIYVSRAIFPGETLVLELTSNSSTIGTVQTLGVIPSGATPGFFGWIPTDTSGASLTFTSVNSGFSINGNMVFAYATLTYPITVDGSSAKIGGLPVAASNNAYANTPNSLISTAGLPIVAVVIQNTTMFNIFNSTTLAPITNVQLTGATLRIMVAYPIV